MTITQYMIRAGIPSRRELSRRTGIAHSTLDDIFAHPSRARLYQIASIAEVCRMNKAEVGEFIEEVANA